MLLVQLDVVAWLMLLVLLVLLLLVTSLLLVRRGDVMRRHWRVTPGNVVIVIVIVSVNAPFMQLGRSPMNRSGLFCDGRGPQAR